MKTNIVALSTLITSLLLQTQVIAADGQLNITGTLVEASCELATENISVALGSIGADVFDASLYSPKEQFTIKLQNCVGGDGIAKVAATFTGSDADGDNVLDIATLGGSEAGGVAIEFFDAAVGVDEVLPLGQQSSGVLLPTTLGDVELDFYAAYKKVGSSVTAGLANGSANFELTYL